MNALFKTFTTVLNKPEQSIAQFLSELGPKRVISVVPMEHQVVVYYWEDHLDFLNRLTPDEYRTMRMKQSLTGLFKLGNPPDDISAK